MSTKGLLTKLFDMYSRTYLLFCSVKGDEFMLDNDECDGRPRMYFHTVNKISLKLGLFLR